MRVNVKVLFFFLALLALAFARPNEPVKPKPSPTPPPPPPKKCVGEILCCQSLGFFTDITVSLLLGLLGIELSASEKGLECGLTCTAFPLHKRDADFCIGKEVCCDRSFEGGILAVGCISFP